MTSHRSGMVRTPGAVAAAGAAALLALAVPGTAQAVGSHHGTAGQPAAGVPAYYDSGLAPTPSMGWNTYYGLGAPTETQVRSVADYLVNSGLRQSGYSIVWLDGGWQADTPATPRAS